MGGPVQAPTLLQKSALPVAWRTYLGNLIAPLGANVVPMRAAVAAGEIGRIREHP
jgi:hypothetical protein